ncbi:MAG TPA: 2-hydroxychromene-2-carboxylate isomerase [Myxococcales bacterium]|nr:2-hydroxychromene-2-carboxylate isomerase [Myxococcales bacterium]
MDFWFDFASTYSYPAAMRVEREAARAGVPVRWRAFLLGPIFAEQQGITDSPFNANPVRGRYMWRDLERICARHGLPWRRPSEFPRRSVLAAKVACAAEAEGAAWLPDFCRAVFTANFALDRDIDDREVLSGLLAGLGQDGGAALARADAPGGPLRARGEEARRLGLFGAPTFAVGEELFFGQDRLQEALEWAVRA